MKLHDSITVKGVSVTLESDDYTTPDGFHHTNGVWQVTAQDAATGKPWRGRSYKGRKRTFKGETAWMRGESLYDAIVSELRFS